MDKNFRHLHQSMTYRVVKEFNDYDRDLHPVDEIWVFIGSNFVPYNDGLSLFATIDGLNQQVRLQWREEEQGGIIDNLEEYLIPNFMSSEQINLKFKALIHEAEEAKFSGWDFPFLNDRWITSQPSWDYREIVSEKLKDAQTLLDMGTGGGEFLSTLPLPKTTFATEGYAPNVPVAKERLEKLGVQVIDDYTDDALPLDNNYFDIVINRHESFSPHEVFRILKPGGLFITQQVGGRDNIQLNEFLQDEVDFEYSCWTKDFAVKGIAEAGFQILRAEEEYPEANFHDIGAVVYYLKIIEWQIADFSVEKYRQQLFKLHQQIDQSGKFTTYNHRFLIEAKK